jgi:hypothetical protein
VFIMHNCRLVLLLFALGLALHADMVSAQGTSVSEKDRQAILEYPLTLPRANAIIAAMEEMTTLHGVPAGPCGGHGIVQQVAMSRLQLSFGALVLVQAVHSIEEYVGRCFAWPLTIISVEVPKAA